ncbi:MAG TPA: VOC family protein [Desulfomonilaceae bacterium]|nr:VOC family protein [Desulfomonilaceae bacterium]
MAVKPIPEGFHTITPFLHVKGAARLLEFLKAAFGATELMRMPLPNGNIMHAEVKIGDSILMIDDVMGEYSPTSASFYLHVPDTDATYRAALAAGGTSVVEPANQFWGDRAAAVQDPAGNNWWIATHIEDVSPEELARRAQEQAGK